MKIQSLLITTLALTILHAQETPADPFMEPKGGAAAPHEGSPPKNISICWETFSLPLAMAADLQREQLADSDLYTRLVAAVEKQTARQETFTVVRAKSGQKATVEAISEQIYPTEFVPKKLPSTAGVPAATPPGKGEPIPKAIDDLNALPTPSAFSTRNTGMTLEIEPTIGEDDDKWVDLRFVPEIVTAAGRLTWGQGISTAEMPVFESQRANTSATFQFNRPFLFSTMNRPPVSKADPEAAGRVWFGFVTATLAKP